MTIHLDSNCPHLRAATDHKLCVEIADKLIEAKVQLQEERDDLYERVLECYRNHTDMGAQIEALKKLVPTCLECLHPDAWHVTGYGCRDFVKQLDGTMKQCSCECRQ